MGKTVVRIAVTLASILGATIATSAQQWPQKPVTWILPVPPGGAVDMSARVLQEGLAKQLGQQIVIESRVGGATRVATEAVKRSDPDGYTFGMVGVAYVSNPSLLQQVNYDPVKDFAHVTFIWQAPSVILVHPSQPYRTLRELLSAAEAKPGSIGYGSPGVGTSMHAAGELLKLSAKVDITHLVYRGAGPALTDVLAGHIPLAVVNIASAAPHIQSGKLRPLAVTSAQRAPLLPDVPTVAESGYPGYEITEWQGLVAPLNTPPQIVERMNQAVKTVIAQPDVAARFHEMGFQYLPMPPRDFTAYVAAQQKKFAEIIRQAKIKPVD